MESNRSMGLEDSSSSPLEIVLTDDTNELCTVFSVFVKQTRKENGEEYTLKSLYLLVGLQREICSLKGRGSSLTYVCLVFTLVP